jgi:protein gp37
VAHRFSGPGLAYEGLVQLDANGKSTGKWNGQIKFVEAHLLDPLKWKGSLRIFVNSMSDLFHENVTDEMRDKIFAVVALCPQHTFQVLTKRPERMLAYLSAADVEARVAKACVLNGQPLAPGYFSMTPGGGDLWEVFGGRGKFRFVDDRVNGGVPCRSGEWYAADLSKWPLPNLHLGVSVENQKTADERIPLLLQTPAAVRFISAEPLLGPVDLFKVPRPDVPYFQWRGETGAIGPKDEPDDYVYWMKRLLHWVICGGESGHGARPMHPDWARSLRDQCKAASVPYFFKQWGEWTTGENVERITGSVQTAIWFNDEWLIGLETLSNDEGHRYDEPDLYRVGTKAAGHLLDGVEHHEFPAVTE